MQTVATEGPSRALPQNGKDKETFSTLSARQGRAGQGREPESGGDLNHHALIVLGRNNKDRNWLMERFTETL